MLGTFDSCGHAEWRERRLEGRVNGPAGSESVTVLIPVIFFSVMQKTIELVSVEQFMLLPTDRGMSKAIA